MASVNPILKKNIKRTLASEFVYIILISIICFSIYKVGEYYQNSYEMEIDNKIKTIDGMPQHQFLWYTLKKHDLYKKNYENFKIDYKNTESQIVLFNLVSNNELYTKGFRDFRCKYFRKEGAIDDAYGLYFNEHRLNDNQIQYQEKEFWNDLRKKEELFKETLKNDSVFVNLYAVFVKQGYKHSIEDLKKLIFQPYVKGLDINEIDSLEKDIKKDKPRYIKTAYDINIFILILFYPFRFIVMGLKWSVKQIKSKNSLD